MITDELITMFAWSVFFIALLYSMYESEFDPKFEDELKREHDEW